ncbi:MULTISPECIES: DUF4411 family protein [unclassified Bradyrhizobium]|uniref:DUF4411 family protein n=1 Tax=unclassified Bradyrhizobium TaxID=2631580 RepID=UPI00211E32F5|nr:MULTISPECIES: DUF4411 family protein [unclassified Bradyrhizobium]MDD1531934.1 hypothetical protein [Bradyrhizobium sp. WBOS8]MDD1584975.1 hypothetical protein [Bradyrhizobium sp. WBOS4]UUO46190.1 hypothetical protein DCM78_04105 [Bradyrhizobium sp. WBOS04]UUO60151.1 hypothetical protein DCM80_13795 [Bradyrhizobium sp. WBOS08]
MAGPKTIYVIDTSSIIKWHVEEYPPSIFEKLVYRIEELIVQGRLKSPRAVFDEARPGDDCHDWCKNQTDLFVEESTSVQTIVRELMKTHHNTKKPHKGISGADPFVIAMAKDGGQHWKVVADEHPGSAENRKIPYVCNAESVECITFKGMILSEGWKF